MGQQSRERVAERAWERLLRRPKAERETIACAALNTLAAEGESLAYVWIRSKVDGLSIRDVAKELRADGVQISPATVQRYIDEAHNLLLGTIDAILDVLDLDASLDTVVTFSERSTEEEEE
jgi:hypothetical protein